MRHLRFLLPATVTTSLAWSLAGVLAATSATAQERPRARDLGIVVGTYAPGPLNAITDVAGVRVGHATVIRGDSVRTGITAIFPHAGNPFESRVPAAVFVGNGFGKLVGFTQVTELGELETPITLTCTLCVWRAAEGVARWMLEQPGMQRVRSINPVVGETNDGWALNAIRSHSDHRGRCPRCTHQRQHRTRGRRQRGCGHRHGGVRVEGGHRHQLAPDSPGRPMDGGRAGAVQLRQQQRPADPGRAGRTGTGKRGGVDATIAARAPAARS